MLKPAIETKVEFETALRTAMKQTDVHFFSSGFSLFAAIRAQLEHMSACTADGRTPSSEERGRTDIGPIAARNLEDTHPDYAKILKELDYAFRRYDSLG